MARIKEVPVAEEQILPGRLLTESLPQVWSARKKIAGFVFIVSLLTAVIMVLTPNRYTAETSILPELEKNKLLGMAGTIDFTAVTGINIGEAPVSKLYPIIIKSARVLREVVYAKFKTAALKDSANLIDIWRIDGGTEQERFEIALKKLQSSMDVTFDTRLGTISLEVEADEAQLAADIANRVTYELDVYTRVRRRTSVTAQREFIEQRLAEVENALKTSEESLRVFREKNRRTIDSPLLTMEEARLARQVQINSTVFIELKKQIEIAKIEEIKNIPIINILDAARPPLRKSAPNRATSVAAAFLISLLLGIAYAGFAETGAKLIRAIRESVQPKNQRIERRAGD